ncbi:EAL domain-containing response regulator [Pseudomonas akapageensis]|uniref:EAL domain-containing response regulator n=1 Tax=Pseudomonas akapageensis TaxID=2609961 RepID=UPI00140BBD7F|nr:EAL domain-containing response regulator [Pseudomonas akapageensis]
MQLSKIPKRILVVDDSRVQREFAVDLCSRLGASEIHQAEDGDQAIALLRQAPQIEVVILDLEMPGMDGVQVLHEMVRLGMDPAVVVVSARESVLLNVVESMGKSLGVKLLGVLQKPVSLEQLAGSLGRFAAVQQREAFQAMAEQVPDLTEHDVATALRERQFVAYFQPKVDLRDGHLCGVEALIRWQHPEHGLLLPGHFIELIERSDAMSAISLLMLDISLQHCRRWHAAGLMVSVSINLSARSLSDSKLADAIIERVMASGIAPRYVMLEITESAIMTDLGMTLGTLARLRLKGFGLSVDDYGTGFSCMLQLSRIPCSELKVDRAFVNGASENLHLRILLESALDIAHKLKLKVVAEGVETLKDWGLLRELGCDEAQGYFVAKPMPGDVVLLWWSTNKERLQKLVKPEGFLRRVLGMDG